MARSQVLASLTVAKDNLKNLQSNLNWYTSNPSESDLTSADSELALAQAKYDAAKAVLESLEIDAPFDGIILAVSAKIGETYQVEATLFTVGDPKALEVLANVTEEDYPLLVIGQDAEVYFDARPEVNVQGKVERIIPKRIEGDHPLYNIYISLKEIPDGLADGMTADTAITIAKRENVLCLPRAVVRASGGDKTTIKVWDGSAEVTKEITIGLRGDTYVEIVSGLSEGEQMVTRTYSMGESTIMALRDADLTVYSGEFIALMGASGSGKSTLLNVIGLLDRPTAGEYWLEEKSVSSLRRDELADMRGKRIGFIFQNFNLLPRLSAWENVALPLAYRRGEFGTRDQLNHAREALSRV